MEDTGRETRPADRELSLLVFGDTADEIELAALDAARAFFGDTVRLEIIPGYRVHDDGDGSLFRDASGGKKYRARLDIHSIES